MKATIVYWEGEPQFIVIANCSHINTIIANAENELREKFGTEYDASDLGEALFKKGVTCLTVREPEYAMRE